MRTKIWKRTIENSVGTVLTYSTTRRRAMGPIALSAELQGLARIADARGKDLRGEELGETTKPSCGMSRSPQR